MIIRGKYFVSPPRDDSNFKELFKRLASEGAGRPVDDDGFSKGPWTPELLVEAISELDANQSGIELRTVQRWFQDNEMGISTANIRWLARIFGCGDPEATSDWQRELSTAKSRLTTKRRKSRNLAQINDTPKKERVPAADTTSDNYVKELRQSFNLAKASEALFGNISSLSLPTLIFCAASALGLISFSLNIHSIDFISASGQAKQVGFLWAPNWTIVFLALLPMYLASLIGLLRNWKMEWRRQLAETLKPAQQLPTWEIRVMAASHTYWAVLFVTVFIASFYNWTATHLTPLLNGDAGGWPVDWGRIAIFQPDIISVASAIVFTGLVFLFNAATSYLFFTGLVFLNVIAFDYLDILKRLRNIPKGGSDQDIKQVNSDLMSGIFRCMSFGMLITIMMKLQSSYLQSDSLNILDWLAKDISAALNFSDASEVGYNGFHSAPGHFYSFFCVLAIYGTFVNAFVRIRLAILKIGLTESSNRFPDHWFSMNGAMLLLVASYFLIGNFTGFSIVMLFSFLLTAYLMIKPAFLHSNSLTEN